MSKIALVTGANQGLGFALSQGLTSPIPRSHNPKVAGLNPRYENPMVERGAGRAGAGPWLASLGRPSRAMRPAPNAPEGR